MYLNVALLPLGLNKAVSHFKKRNNCCPAAVFFSSLLRRTLVLGYKYGLITAGYQHPVLFCFSEAARLSPVARSVAAQVCDATAA